MKQKFQVTGMSCASCSAHVEKAVGGIGGVEKVAVSLLTNSMTVEYDQSKTDAAAIVRVVENAGYGASVSYTHLSSGLNRHFPSGIWRWVIWTPAAPMAWPKGQLIPLNWEPRLC